MRLTKKDIKALQTLIDHIETDLSYFAGGTYYDINEFEAVDKKSVKLAKHGIDFIKTLISTSELK